jgi:hypothetical protein
LNGPAGEEPEESVTTDQDTVASSIRQSPCHCRLPCPRRPGDNNQSSHGTIIAPGSSDELVGVERPLRLVDTANRSGRPSSDLEVVRSELIRSIGWLAFGSGELGDFASWLLGVAFKER